MTGFRGIGRIAACGLVVLAAGAARAEEGNIFSNLFKYGGTTVPPSQPKELEAAYCPTVDVPAGASALTTPPGAQGNPAAIRSQVTLGRIARECTRRTDGSITVKVGVEARVLLGPAGAPGRFDVPFTISILRDGATIASRVRRVAVTVAPGEAQGFMSVVEDDIAVPVAATGDYEIVVGLGGGASKTPKQKPRRRAPVSAAPTSEAPAADAGEAQ